MSPPDETRPKAAPNPLARNAGEGGTARGASGGEGAAAPTAPGLASTRQRMERLAWLLDGAITVPGTSLRFGLEPILGLIPVVGDVLGMALGAVIVYEAVKVGAPRPLIVRMLGNATADAVLGVVPVLGDVMDFAFKSNQRNARLLMTHLDAVEGLAQTAPGGSRWMGMAMVVGVVAGVAGLAALAWQAFR